MSHAGSAFNVRGGDLHLLVGQNQTYFRIHSHFFIRESEWWKKQLLGSEPTADAPLIKGTSRANAYALREEPPEDFRHFLEVFYNNNYGNYSHITTEQWMVIQHYANRWGFKDVLALAMRSLDNQPIDTAERIVLYQRHKVPNKCIFQYYIALASRPEGLKLEECRILGYKNNWFLHHARSDLYDKLLSSNSARSLNDLSKADIATTVMAAYSKTIKNMDPTPVTEDESKRPAGDVEDEDEREKSETGSWEDVDGDTDEKWDLSVPGAFS